MQEEQLTAEQRAACAALGLVGADLVSFLRGEAAVIYLDPERRSGVAVVQRVGARLRCGVVALRDPGRGVQLLARFRGRCQTLAVRCGATELELFGAAVINPKLERMLLRQRFERRPDDIPAALGGGRVEILARVFPVELEPDA